MTMTPAELEEHAANLRALLECKRREIGTGGLGPGAVRILTGQVDALTNRVDQLMWQCQLLRGDLPTLQLVRPLPGLRQFPDVVPQP